MVVVSSITTTMTTIISGVIVYGDQLGSDPVAIIAGSSAFIAVVAAAALLPMVPDGDAAAPAAQRA